MSKLKQIGPRPEELVIKLCEEVPQFLLKALTLQSFLFRSHTLVE